MLHDAVDRPGDLDPDELLERYENLLAGVIEARGAEAVAETSGVDLDSVRALAGGESPGLTLEEAAAILATADDAPDAETIVAEALDGLLLGMTNAVLDVEAVEAGIDRRLDAREIQQKVEGRLETTLAEYALLQAFIEGRAR